MGTGRETQTEACETEHNKTEAINRWNRKPTNYNLE